MIVSKKAVPTEYKGVRFRSKSEACFARYLSHHKRRWEYEPQSLRLDCGYVPDFMLVDYDSAGLRFRALLIEYKPKLPSDTYADGVFQKLAILCNHVGFDCDAAVFHGSFFGNAAAEVPCVQMSQAGRIVLRQGWLEPTDEWPLRQQISQHRFDLVSELSEWKGHL